MRQRRVSVVLATVVTMGAALGGLLGVLPGTEASAATTSGVTVAGGNGDGAAANQLSGPSDVFADASGDVFVVDANNERVQEWAPGATSGVTVAGGNGQGSAANQLDNPNGVFVDGAGNVYVGDTGNSRVQKWAPGATSGVTVAGGNGQGSAANQLDHPSNVFVNAAGDVYVCSGSILSGDGRVSEWAPGATSGVTVATLGTPAGLSVDSAGDVYVADDTGDTVQEWAPGASAGVTVAGGNGDGSAANQFFSPVGLFVDGAGDIYVDDTGNSRVQEWAPGASDGMTVAGGNGKGSAANQLNNEFGVAVDGAGDVYVADYENDRVQEWKVGPSGAPLVTIDPQSQTVTGGGNVTFSADAIAKPFPTEQWQQSTDGGSTWSDIAGATSVTYSIPGVPLSENGLEFRAVLTNSAGSAMTDAATLTVTAPPPTTRVVLPANGATVSGGTWLDAAASSPVGIASVTYEVSGGSISDQVIGSGTATLYGYLAGWDTTDVPNGTYTLQSVATDTSGVSTTSAGVTVSVDNLPLHSAVLVPSSGATLSGSAAVLDASASGTSDVTSVQFEVSGGSLSDKAVSPAAPTLYGWIGFWNTTTVPNGTYTLQSVATEVGGTTATSPGITVTVSN